MFRFLAFRAAALFAVPAIAAEPAPAIYTANDGLGARGYDPVAYITRGKALKCSATLQLGWGGATWRFASAESLAAFKADPDRYAPLFGGYCAWAVSQHYLAPGDPNYWKIVNGKLYLNANSRAKELWEADQADAIERGHANWPAVLTDNQDGSK